MVFTPVAIFVRQLITYFCTCKMWLSGTPAASSVTEKQPCGELPGSQRQIVVRRARPRPSGPAICRQSAGASVKCEHGSQRNIDRLHLNGAEPASELSEAMLRGR
jgi:hypothetical protein